MKIRLLIAGLLLMLTLLSLSPAHAQRSFCEMAHSDCYAQKQAYFKSCQLLGGSFVYCFNAADAIYEGCMGAWGCVPLNN